METINAFGDKIRKFRKERKWTLEKVSGFLNVDQAILSKAERGMRNLSKKQVLMLAQKFEVSPEILLVPWIADKVAQTVGSESEFAGDALRLAERIVAYRNYEPFNLRRNYQDLVDVVSKFGGIEQAWVYGSFAKRRVNRESDINIALKTTDMFTYFDLAEVHNKLEKRLGRPIDIGWIDDFKAEVWEEVKQGLILIYDKG